MSHSLCVRQRTDARFTHAHHAKGSNTMNAITILAFGVEATCPAF